MSEENKQQNTEAMQYDTVLGIVYIVIVAHGKYEDYTKENIFATNDKNKAEKWRDRFNKIIHTNHDRIYIKYEESGFKVKPFWYDKVCNDEHKVMVDKVEWR